MSIKGDIAFFMEHWQVSRAFAAHLAADRAARARLDRENAKSAAKSAKLIAKMHAEKEKTK